MKTTLTIENIYSMLSSLSVNNKKWLADHLYEDISGVQVRRRRGALSDEELEAELSGSPLLDMNDYEPLTDEQFKGLVHSRPIPISLEGVYVSLPNSDFNLLKTLSKKMGWSIKRQRKSGIDKALDDIKAGRVFEAKSVEDLFEQLEK